MKSCDIQQCKMLTQMNRIYVETSKNLGSDQWKINFMNELIDIVHKTAECGLSLKRLSTYYGF